MGARQELISSRSLGAEKSSWYLGLCTDCTRRDLFISVGFLNFCGGLGYPISSLKGWLIIFYIDNLMIKHRRSLFSEMTGVQYNHVVT